MTTPVPLPADALSAVPRWTYDDGAIRLDGSPILTPVGNPTPALIGLLLDKLNRVDARDPADVRAIKMIGDLAWQGVFATGCPQCDLVSKTAYAAGERSAT